MKLHITRNAAKVVLLSAALLATSLFAGSANAQSAFEGKFTLPQETRWGQAVLPPGDYLILIDNSNSKVEILDAKSHRTLAYEPVGTREDAKGRTALFIDNRGSERVVQSLRVAELGKTFIYDRPHTSRRAVERANNTETVTVLAAKK